ncbi:histidine phosphatase family protein [Billgrantia endophytica]|uniref:Histidine phosphatase family protein n=1 Tax=Billgrantia endophytica TaxID=2033802 RepID=A0A2N7UE62_9GAMM|nr:histidine phosphatase family protein [Halomonas endophytica]PMR78744.1 histidine phosphatase family protein [Halomonas endophytica]
MASADRLDLVVVRHGLTAWNREQRYQGQRDIPLLLPDALEGMDRLRDKLAGERFDAVYCSDLTRCRQTLAHVLDVDSTPAEPRLDARLRELDFGAYEGKCYVELKDEPLYRAWIDTRGEQPPPGGESTANLRQRLDTWLADLFRAAEAEGHRRILAVSHGGVIRELRRRFEAIDFWDGSVGQAQGRQLTFTHQRGDWLCSSSSAVPVPASVMS